jgi:acyl dehydratase
MAPLELESPRALKDFVGRELGVTSWFTVTQERIRQFADATEDHQWIHLDRERAKKESPYGATVAHGFLTLSLLGHLLKQAVHIRGGVRSSVNYGLNRVRFPAPVPADSTIRARFSLQAFKELPDAVEAVYLVTAEVENAAKPSCVAEWVVRYNL